LAFLNQIWLRKEYKVNIEANHATLAGHSFAEEVATLVRNNLLGSIDANRGDPQLGWDTDHFPNEVDSSPTCFTSFLSSWAVLLGAI